MSCQVDKTGRPPTFKWQPPGTMLVFLIAEGAKLYRGKGELHWVKTIKVTQSKNVTHYEIPYIFPDMVGNLWCSDKTYHTKGQVALTPTPKGEISLGHKGINSNFAYNCSEGKISFEGPAHRATQLLQIRGVVRAHIADPEDETQVIIEEEVFNVTCKKVQIRYTGNGINTCYAGNAQAVHVRDGNYASFRDRLGYLIENPARIECLKKNKQHEALRRVERSIAEEQAEKSMTQAILGVPFADLSVIFNQKAAYSMVVLSELCLCSMNSMTGISDLYVLYRKYAALGTLILSIGYLIWTGSLFAVALCFRISPCSALRLIFPSYRRWRELITLRKDTILKEEERKRIEDRLMKNLPVCEFDDMAGRHFQEIYKNLHSLNKKFRTLEEKVGQHKRSPRPVKKARNFRSTIRSYLSIPTASKEDIPKATIEETILQEEPVDQQTVKPEQEHMVEDHQDQEAATEQIKLTPYPMERKAIYNIRKETRAKMARKESTAKESEKRKPDETPETARKKIKTVRPPTLQTIKRT